MEKNETKKLKLMSNQQMALSDLWPNEFCFPYITEIVFGPLDDRGVYSLEGINLYIDSLGSFDHITTYLGFQVYDYSRMSALINPGDQFRLPDYPITIIYQKMPVSSPIAAILSGYPPGYGR